MNKFTREDIVQGVYFIETFRSGNSHKMAVDKISGEKVLYTHTIRDKPWCGQTSIEGLVLWLNEVHHNDHESKITKHLPVPKRSRREVLEDM